MNPETEHFDDLPAALAARLKEADRALPILDPRVDDGVLGLARRQFAARAPRSLPARRRWFAPVAAAATLLVAFLIVVRPFDLRTSSSPDDIDGSGQVDILDAFALARLRASGGDAAAGVSEQRIEALAARIVALNSPRSLR